MLAEFYQSVNWHWLGYQIALQRVAASFPQIRCLLNGFDTFGHKVNVQDNATVHCTYEKFPTVVGNNVSIGHNAIVHGCTIEDNVLIGMGAIVMDDCVVGEGCIVAAGSVVTQGKKLAPGTLWAGVPAKEIGPVPERLRKGEIERIANNYLKYSSWYKDDAE